MKQWLTVAPLSHYFHATLLHHLPIELAEGIILCRMPEYGRREDVLAMLGLNHRETLAKRTLYALEARGEGADVHDRQGIVPGGTRLNTAVQALWLANPANLEYELMLQFEGDELRFAGAHVFDRRSLLEEHTRADVTLADVERAAELHARILSLPRDGTLWLVLAIVNTAREAQYSAINYLISWVALEALFGSTDTRNVTARLKRRISCFFKGDEKVTSARVAELYDLRSRVAHGLRGAQTDALSPALFEAQEIIRRATARALTDGALLLALDGAERETFLDQLT